MCAFSQTALEEADGCAGKYTVGLGQEALGFFDDREDVGSVLMTALARLMETYGIKPEMIGRLEVGTETLIDKSKSVKTTMLEHLFGRNHSDVEGVTSTNACYGGTAALLNSAAWIESSAWDGRYAVVVCGDIAVYEKGPARPTGGGGAVAILLGPDAPLAIVGPRCTHAVECYDFYKPRGDTEYAMVDGKLSQSAYLTGVDVTWAGLKRKLDALAMEANLPIPRTSLDSFAHACLHSPYNKLVQKGFARMLYGDIVDDPSRAEWAADAEAQAWAKVKPSDSVNDREAEKPLRRLSESRFRDMCTDTHTISRQVGNCYTAAVYMNLASLVCNKGGALEGEQVLMYSYGSGAVATAFILRGRAPTGRNSLSLIGKHAEPFTLDRISAAVQMNERLEGRTKCDVTAFGAAMDLRAARYGKCDYEPTGSVDALAPGTYYLEKVDQLYRRTYARKPL